MRFNAKSYKPKRSEFNPSVNLHKIHVHLSHAHYASLPIITSQRCQVSKAYPQPLLEIQKGNNKRYFQASLLFIVHNGLHGSLILTGL